mgnify:CR=1 FL=1
MRLVELITFKAGELHELVGAWWAVYHGNRIHPDMLSSYGIAVLDKGLPIAVTHIYPAITAKLAWVGFTITDPMLSRYKAGKAIMKLMAGAEESIKALGYTVLYTGFDAPALQKLMKRRGYHEGSYVVEQWKVV